VIVHLGPQFFDSRRVAADDALREVLRHAGGRSPADTVGDRRFADAGDALVGFDLDDDRVQLARRDEVDVRSFDFHLAVPGAGGRAVL
jgi:Arc/MetJ family transcription regulator